MLRILNVNDFFKTEIPSFSRETLLLISNFLILEKIKKLDNMTEVSFLNYIRSRNLNGNGISMEVGLVKKSMIIELSNKSTRLEDQSVFVLRNELSNFINYFQEDSKVQKKLVHFLTDN